LIHTQVTAHFQENLWSVDVTFSPEELKQLSGQPPKIKIVGNRYPGKQVQRIKLP